MKKIITVLFSLLLIFTSCFDVVEKIKMNDDGSGTLLLVLNASKSKTRLNSISKSKTINGKKVPTKQEIQDKIKVIEKYCNESEGINNVTTSIDWENYIVKFSCEFKNVNYLDKVLEKLNKENHISKEIPTNIYAYDSKKKIFYKHKQKSYLTDYNKLDKTEKEIFTSATYTSIIQFPTEIIENKNNHYEISPSKKSIKISESVLDFIKGEKQMYNSIKFK